MSADLSGKTNEELESMLNETRRRRSAAVFALVAKGKKPKAEKKAKVEKPNQEEKTKNVTLY